MNRRNVLSLVLSLSAVTAFAVEAQAANRGRSARRVAAARRMARTPRPARARTRQAQQLQMAAAGRLNPNGVQLTQSDERRLDDTADRFESEIRQSFTPVVDLHIAQVSTNAGVRWRKIQNPRFGTKGPTIFEVEGIDKAGGELAMVLSGGASGHVMQQQYGGRPMSVVEGYGQNDTVYLTHRRPGQTRTERLVQTKSRGLVTQEGFNVKLEKGTHDFFYFRGGPNEASGGEGSEPELRHVQIIVK